MFVHKNVFVHLHFTRRTSVFLRTGAAAAMTLQKNEYFQAWMPSFKHNTIIIWYFAADAATK